MPDSPNLRDLVDMLPGEMMAVLPAYPRPDGQWRTLRSGSILFEDEAEDAILGYLVEWLGERGGHIEPSPVGYDAIVPLGDLMQIVSASTSIEAAVMAVGVCAWGDSL